MMNTKFLSLRRPLLKDTENDGYFVCDDNDLVEQQKMLKRFTFSSVMLGLLVGVFIQFSTLGANWTILSFFGSDALATATNNQLIIYSMSWSAITSAMSMWILSFLHNIVTFVFLSPPRRSDNTSEAEHRQLDYLLLTMESRFVAGALVGVCVAWTITDYLLGMQTQMLYSIITMGFALLWGWILSSIFASHNHQVNEAAEESALVADNDDLYLVRVI